MPSSTGSATPSPRPSWIDPPPALSPLRRRMLFTCDPDLLTEASRRLRDGQPLVGLVYARRLHVTIGQCVRATSS